MSVHPSIEASNLFNDHRVAARDARVWFIGEDNGHVAVKVRTADWHWLNDNGYDPEEFEGGLKPDEDEDAEDRKYFPFRVVAFPCVQAKCPTCDGKGTHVNPSIDAGGITDFDEWDYDEQDAYMSGVYDVRCYGCNGQKTTPAINVEAMGPEDLKAYTTWREWQDEIEREEADYRAERAAEIRWGC